MVARGRFEVEVFSRRWVSSSGQSHMVFIEHHARPLHYRATKITLFFHFKYKFVVKDGVVALLLILFQVSSLSIF